MSTIINGIKVNGNYKSISVTNGKIYVDGRLYNPPKDSDERNYLETEKKIIINIYGNVKKVDAETVNITGIVQGNIDATTIIIKGDVNGDIDANEVEVTGDIKGNIDANEVYGRY